MAQIIIFFIIGNLVAWFIDSAKKSQNEVKKFYSAFEQAGDGIFITDKKGNIEYVNEAFEKISGFSAQEIKGKTPRFIKSGKHSNDFFEKLWKTIKNGKIFRGTFINRRKTGELFYTDHTITPVKDSRGNIINYVGIWKDITKNKEIEKRKDEFMSIASHELKTPLTSIKGYAQILRKKLATSENRQFINYIRRMEMQIDNMTRLVFELLDLTRITAGKLSLNKGTFNISKLIDECIKDLQITTECKIKYLNNDKKYKVTADRERISQVIKNLLSNAIKYSNKTDSIIVACRTEKNKVTVSIKDSGIGIPKNETLKIFDRFYQSSRNNQSHSPSFGIGLYISDQIIKQHNGKIWVESKEGAGSTFYFSIPSET